MRILITLLFSSLFIGLFAQTQVYDSISMSPGYTNMIYYKMDSTTSGSIPDADWDLQFSTVAFSASIRINSGAGVQVFAPVNQDTSMANWNALDTTGMTQLRDSDTSWEEGAFLAQATGHPDYGWGMYIGQGTLIGTKLFVVKSSTGIFWKMFIRKLDGGTKYIIEFETVDGNNNFTALIDKTLHSNANFFYYDIELKNNINQEPGKDSWDFTMRKYETELSPGVFYNVTGILTNIKVATAEAAGVDVNSVTPGNQSFSENISNIGYDWKSYNSGWTVADLLAYFVKDRDGDIWKIVFTKFGGATNGTTHFWKQLVQSVGFDNPASSIQQLAVSPNPAQQYVNVLFGSDQPVEAIIRLFDINGRPIGQWQVQGNDGLNNFRVPLENLNVGYYFINLEAEGANKSISFIKMK